MSAQSVDDIMGACEAGQGKVSTDMPFNISGGDIYVVALDSLAMKKDVRVDKYMWVNNGRRRFPKKKPTMFKSFFKIKLVENQHSQSFQKHIYERLENGKFAIIHYLGDPTIYTPLAHGNSKSKETVFIRTNPSVIEHIKSRADDETVSANFIDKEFL